MVNEWTTELPTQPGWYWVWLHADNDRTAFVVELESVDGVLSWDAYYDMPPWTNLSAIGSHWIGPLPVPAPPKEIDGQ